MTKRSLVKPKDVRRYLSSLIFKTERGEVSCNLARNLGYLCSILLKSQELSDIESRLAALEEGKKP